MRRNILLAAIAVALVAHPGTAAAQSLFATGGLGVPVAPVDARARVLGGTGVGLTGLNTSLVNPAASASAVGRGAAAAFQPTRRSVEFRGSDDVIGDTRFPYFRILYPVGRRFVAGVGYGGFLDQSWKIESTGTELVGGDSVAVRDRTESDGGINQLRIDASYDLTSTLVVGGAAGIYTGSVTRTLTRTFPDTTEAELRSFRTRGGWDYAGPLASLGVRWDPLSTVRTGASVTWGGTLDADADEGDVSDRTFDLPWRVSAGASAQLAPRLLAALSGQWTGWSTARDDFEDPDRARDAWKVGGGLEWEGPEIGQRNFPVRLGGHYGELPFRATDEAPTEWSVGLGVGFRLAGSEARPLAMVDTSLERGGRGDEATTGLTEEFWRFTLSLAVFGQ